MKARTSKAFLVGVALSFCISPWAQQLTYSLGALAFKTQAAISADISGLGTGVATLLGGASSGTGGPAGTTSPAFTTPDVGAATGTTIALASSVNGNALSGEKNVNTGSAANAQVYAANDGSTGLVRMTALGTSFTTSGANVQDGGVFECGANLSGGCSLVAQVSPLRTYVGGAASGNLVDTLTTTTRTEAVSLILLAGTTSLAPLNIPAGTLLTSPVAGTVENDGTNFYGTESTTRYILLKGLSASATLNFPSCAATSGCDLTITDTGCALNDEVILGIPNGSMGGTGNTQAWTAWVSSADTVTVRMTNAQTVGAIDPASGTFRVTCVKH